VALFPFVQRLLFQAKAKHAILIINADHLGYCQNRVCS
jgi:hypothetical protein